MRKIIDIPFLVRGGRWGKCGRGMGRERLPMYERNVGETRDMGYLREGGICVRERRKQICV